MSAPATPSDNRVSELQSLQLRLARAQEHASAALQAGRPGDRPGEALRRFLAADAEATALARQIRQFATVLGQDAKMLPPGCR